MSSRFAPHRIRARYLTALRALPIPVNLADLTDPPDPARLTVLGTETVAGREVRFGTVASAPRLWMALSETRPAVSPATAVPTAPTDSTGPISEAAGLIGPAAPSVPPNPIAPPGPIGSSGPPAPTDPPGPVDPTNPPGLIGSPDRSGPTGAARGLLLGYVTGLVVGEPDLWVCDGAHRDWVLAADTSRELKLAAARVWFSCIADCEG